jgi:hypothetical protein
MSLLYRLATCVGLFVAGFLLNAWSPWAEGQPSVRPGSPLAVMDYESYGKVIRDPELEEEAARFLVELDSNYPGTATELLLAIVMLHELYGEPYLAGCQISAYADRYGDAQAILTAHLLKDAPSQHRERFLRLRAILNELNRSEAEYDCIYCAGGSGCYRDRREEHLQVEDTLSRWALRLTHQPDSFNPDPVRSFRKLQQYLASSSEAVDKELASDPDRAWIREPLIIPRGHVITAFNRLIEELKAWPPEVAEDLSPLILRTFQE